MRRSKKNTEKYIALSAEGKKFEFRDILNGEVKVNNKTQKIKFRQNNGLNFIIYKNKKYLVDILEKDQNKYEIIVNGIGHSFTVESPFSYRRKKFLEKSKQNSKTESITAPMPGKIVDVLVENHAEINKGEPIIILEAMKMQNEILSHVSGTIKNIHVKKNENVMKDDLILEVEK
ncbi:MAG: acetyl-CoA carboxylase biotin carboxyl carrier protein subunit [Bacteroidetes bacterium]|jgi:biotin carboxyl carrier protein|nr:acetyl-CoA carboxylase biotin carboxyl carrier protein subunit [Bacteroidota bacterium]